MRLDKLTIGSDKAPINGVDNHRFKNLKNVTIDFDQDHWVTVVIGWNGTGKSNVLEALVIIFRDLIAKKRIPVFAFQLAYRMGAGDNLRQIHIDADPDREKDALLIHVADAKQIKQNDLLHSVVDFGDDVDKSPQGNPIKLSTFLDEKKKYLPSYVFSYYSGESPRMQEVFRPYQETYDSKLRNGDDPGLKRLFYAMPAHSQFVLLAFMINQSPEVRELLENELGIDPDEGVESVLFVLKQPGWSKRRGNKKVDVAGDERFWGAKGVVRTFLDRLLNISLAPVRLKRDKQITHWNKETTEFQYLFVKDIDALRRLVGEQQPAKFFRDLESTYVSELIEEVRIRVRLKKSDGSVTFREMSEGEQQLLTVLGLLRFTAEEESLFLLDEPDTHLNPQWCINYLSYLQKFAGLSDSQGSTSHILLTTHNPLSIAELVKEQVQILERSEDGDTLASNPRFDPRGMGVAGILTSDLFRLQSSLDRETLKDLETETLLSRKTQLNDEERQRLSNARKRLAHSGFRLTSLDPLMEEYLRARHELVGAVADTNTTLKEYPGSARRRRIARKILLHALGLSNIENKKDDPNN